MAEHALPPGLPRTPPPLQEVEAILAEVGQALRASTFAMEGRVQFAQALQQRGYQYEALSCMSGTIVPVIGREAFPSNSPTFSIFDPDAAAKGVSVIPLSPEPKTDGWLPASIGVGPAPPQMLARRRWQRSYFVAEIEGGRCVASPWGYAVFSRDGSYATDFCNNDGPLIPWGGVAPNVVKIPGTVAILPQTWSNAVYHWLVESVPRFNLLRLAGFPPEKIDHVVTRSIEPWQWECIDLLGIPREKVGVYGNGFHIEADRLLVCSNLENYDYSVSPPYLEPEPWVSRALSELVPDPDPQAEPTERVYIARTNAPSRRVINGEELQGFLERNGFRTVLFEEMSMVDKATLLRRTKVLVSPIGAALAHIPFMRPGTSCVVLYSEDIKVTTGWALCGNAGVAHIHVVSPSLARFYPVAISGMPDNTRELLVDIKLMAETMRACGIEVS